MIVHRLEVGKLAENTYILEKDKQALIVDPGDELNRITDKIEELEVKPLAVLLTHTHHDHIAELDNVRDIYDIEAYVHPNEQDWLQNPDKNLSFVNERGEFTRRQAEHEFTVDTDYQIGPFTFQVVETPGHSPGGVSFIFTEDKTVITGDALFKESIGRTDLPGGNYQTIIQSIQQQLFQLDDDYIAYPGHGDSTTIGHEKQHNPYL